MDATQIILIVVIVLLIVIYPIMITARNKKENQRMQEQTNSLKRGDKVLTTSGVYGTIVDLQLENDKKVVTIETGTDKKKGYISVDAYAIYTIFKDEEKKDENQKIEESVDNVPKIEESAVAQEENKEETATVDKEETSNIEDEINVYSTKTKKKKKKD